MQKKITGIVAGILVLGGGFFYWNKLENDKAMEEVAKEQANAQIDTTPIVNATTSETVASTTTAAPVKNKYKDGTYKVTTTYMSPGGKDNLGVSVTIVNDKIVDSTVTNMAGDGESKSYQNRFMMRFKKVIVGQSIDGLKLNVTSGASLTTNSFNDALTKIRQQALN
jgi:uncharacterized protein with FMN-binding domain